VGQSLVVTLRHGVARYAAGHGTVRGGIL